MDYNATCGHVPVPYMVKLALMSGNVLLAAMSLFLLPSRQGSAASPGGMSAAARQLKETYFLDDPIATAEARSRNSKRGYNTAALITVRHPSLAAAAGGCGSAAQRCLAAALWLMSACLAFYPIAKISWLASSVIRHVWSPGMPYLCGVAFVHDMDIVGCNLLFIASLNRSVDAYWRDAGSWRSLSVCFVACMTMLAAAFFLTVTFIYSTFAVLAYIIYGWCALLLSLPVCCIECCIRSRAAQRRRGSESEEAEATAPAALASPASPLLVGPAASAEHAAAALAGIDSEAQAPKSVPQETRQGGEHYSLAYVIFQPDARVFSARDKLKLLYHFGMMQLLWLVPALLAGVGVQLFAGAGYMEAFSRDWDQRHVMLYINSAIDSLRDNVLSRGAMSVLSYII